MDVEDSQQQKTTMISLLVKTPNQAREDQVVEGIDPNWTVYDLKAHLSTVYPTNPAVSEQRLIYAGKLLPNHLHVKDIFRQTDSTPTLHLVCAFRNPPQGSLGARPKTVQTEQRPMAVSASPGPSGSSTVQTPSTPELRQRRQTGSASDAAPAHTHPPASPPWAAAWSAAAAAAVPGAPQMTQPAFPTYSLYSPQQLLWLQHVYARQYYMQYQAALAVAGSAPNAPGSVTGQYAPVPAHQVPVPAPLANQDPINNLPANQNPAQDGGFIDPGQANQNIRMNAQGGAVMENGDDVEHDWLDCLYTLARLCILMIIVYFNSNLSRFLLVMGTLFLMYLHTAGLFPFRRPQAQRPDHVPQPPEVRHNQQNENRIPNPNPAEEIADEQGEGPADGAEGQGPMTAVLVPPHRVSAMWTAWVFFKTFFSSLIPEAPQGVAN